MPTAAPLGSPCHPPIAWSSSASTADVRPSTTTSCPSSGPRWRASGSNRRCRTRYACDPHACLTTADCFWPLGSDYVHKNRPFAMRLVDELRRRHGWDGLLVLAGAHVEHGSSRDAERALLQERPELAQNVVDLGRVSAGEKEWLLRNADAHVCASNYEGFGLAPLEAAAARRPCIFAPCTSLGEIIDRAAATIVPWDPVASAEGAAPLLTPGEARDSHLSRLADALGRYRWRDVAGQLRDIYVNAVAAPYGAPRSWDELRREDLIVELDAARAEFQDRVAYGMALVDSRNALLSRAQQRGLMRVASRRWLRRPLLAPFSLFGADGHDTDTDPAQ